MKECLEQTVRPGDSSMNPPYYAVIFTSEQSDDLDGYAEMAERMKKLAGKQPGFLGVESIRNGREGMTISYWQTVEDIRTWKANIEHLGAQTQGKSQWYNRYRVRIAKVEHEYGNQT
jgi:heme-degrading monooxygenase HmoA